MSYACRTAPLYKWLLNSMMLPLNVRGDTSALAPPASPYTSLATPPHVLRLQRSATKSAASHQHMTVRDYASWQGIHQHSRCTRRANTLTHQLSAGRCTIQTRSRLALSDCAGACIQHDWQHGLAAQACEKEKRGERGAHQWQHCNASQEGGSQGRTRGLMPGQWSLYCRVLQPAARARG